MGASSVPSPVIMAGPLVPIPTHPFIAHHEGEECKESQQGKLFNVAEPDQFATGGNNLWFADDTKFTI